MEAECEVNIYLFINNYMILGFLFLQNVMINKRDIKSFFFFLQSYSIEVVEITFLKLCILPRSTLY